MSSQTSVIHIDFLKNYPQHIVLMAQLWHQLIAKVWVPEVSLQQAIDKFTRHCNDNVLPMTLLALDAERPVGMCSLRETEGVKENLMPWLSSLVVDPVYQNRGIGQLLIEKTQQKACDLGFDSVYLLAFDPTIPTYYQRLGWQSIGTDTYGIHPVIVMKKLLAPSNIKIMEK